MGWDGLACSGNRAVAEVVGGVPLIKSPVENLSQDTQLELVTCRLTTAHKLFTLGSRDSSGDE